MPKPTYAELENLVAAAQAQVKKLAAAGRRHNQTTKALQAERDLFATVVDGLDAAVFTADIDTHEILFINSYTRRRFGEVLGQKCWQTLLSGQTGPCQSCAAYQRLRADGELPGVDIWEHKNAITGSWYELHDQAVNWLDGRLVRLHMAIDITARKETAAKMENSQAQLLQARKMAGLAGLAAGLGHDFSPLLTTIQGHADLGLLKVDRHTPLAADLTAIRTASLQAAELLRQLLLFGGNQPLELTRLHLGRTIGELAPMLNSLMGPDIVVNFDLAPELALIKADEASLEQALMNLAYNAKEALPTGGSFSIRAENVTVAPSYCELFPFARPGEFVRLTITDTGVGMTVATAARAFEPFFTTRPDGQHSGLGLAAVYGIVKRHHGWINLHSRAGQGTKFKIYLPAE